MTEPDRRQEIRQRVRQLSAGGYLPSSSARQGATSDLSIDESLLLHSIGWEAVDLVCGAGARPVPIVNWNWGSAGEIVEASGAWTRALDDAALSLRGDCARAGGHGVVGVRIEVTVERHFVNAVMDGTAVAPIGAAGAPAQPFASDLSGRDFVLLQGSGWDPVGLAFGSAFVSVPRRSAATALRQATQNVELTNFTDALYTAREEAMARMQESAAFVGAQGVVGVQVREGPLEFAGHVVTFTSWGTAVRSSGRGSALSRPNIVVSLDEVKRLFQATALRG
jgi:uncharacterized protein YbjQ (UPF0145 family)